ncbi:MAG: phosphoribosylamine--glycine ligase [Pseudomonadota bacterium]
MKVLIIGSGGREHALAWGVAKSTRVTAVFVAPGNAGSAQLPKTRNVDLGVSDFDALINFASEQQVGLTIVGPEAPLVDGIVDRFQAAGLRCFGPSQGAAQLEGSKSFTKDFLARHSIPTGAYAAFDDYAAAAGYIDATGAPLVVKADGLAAGKGVVIAHDAETAKSAARDMLEGARFGSAGERVVIEQFLEGEEASFIVAVDGTHVVPLATSQDHKARDDGDVGPNTGGMGAYSPAPVIDEALHARVMSDVIEPTVRGMAADGHPYTGFLYAGLMIAADGTPYVLEYNCRLGDPEAQVLLLRMRSELPDLCEAALDGALAQYEAEWDARVALGVVMASGGYPGAYETGQTITGLGPDPEGCKVFHAATRHGPAGITAHGGRVLCVCALGDTVADAQAAAYARVDEIEWEDAFCRRDIGYRAIARERAGE